MHRNPMELPLVRATALAFVAASSIAAISLDQAQTQDQQVHCVLDDGTVVECDDNDEDYVYHNGSWHRIFLYTDPNRYPVGSTIPLSTRSSWIQPSDAIGRQNAGLPAHGKVSGTVTHSGGFGSASSGSAGS